MKLRSLTLALASVASAATFAAPLTTGNIVLNIVGDGAAAPSAAAAPINFLEFAPTGFGGAPIQTISVTSSGANAITQSGSAGSEGGISGIHGGNGLYFVGYQADAGTAAVVSTTGATNPRRVGRLDYATGLVSFTTLDPTVYSGNNIRFVSGYTTTGNPGSNFVTAGNAANPNGGARSGVFGTSTTVLESGTLANTRVSHAFEGALYTSAMSGAFLGVSRLNAAGDPTLVVNAGTGASTYDFQFFNGGEVAYLIDDRTAAAGGGLAKYVRQTNGTYTKVYTYAFGTNGGTQFAATLPDASGNVTFYAVSGLKTLYSVTDNVSAGVVTATGTPTLLYTAGTNLNLKGVEVVPEPATMAAMALGLGTLLARRRRKAA